MHYVIVGNSTAAVSAIEAIRESDREGKITVISPEGPLPYGRPLISYWLEGKVTGKGLLYRGSEFYEENKVDVLSGERAVELDVQSQTVTTQGGGCLTYDRLLLACGGRPIIPSITGLDQVSYHMFLSLEDSKRLGAACGPGEEAVVIGGGLIGLKTAEALVGRGLRVTVVELADSILGSTLPPRAAAVVQRHLEGKGMGFRLGETVSAVSKSEGRLRMELSCGGQLLADHLVLAIGVVPNTALVSGTPVEVNRGIVVDEYMQTSVAGVYAAGDVAEAREALTGEPMVVATLPNATAQGRIAGRHMSGQPIEPEESMIFNSIPLLSLNVVTIGLTRGRQPPKGVCTVYTQEDYGYRELRFQDDRLVGAIFIGGTEAIERSGVVRHLIYRKVAVGELADRMARGGSVGVLDLPVELFAHI